MVPTSDPGALREIDIAIVCHEANRAYCEALGDDGLKSWNASSDWQRLSVIDGVAWRMRNMDAPAAATHDNWLRFKRLEGWSYGPARAPAKKQHPGCVLFDQLPPEQRAKDELFAAIVRALAPSLSAAEA